MFFVVVMFMVFSLVVIVKIVGELNFMYECVV